MRRRQFIALVGSAAAWPLAGRAQQAPTPLMGVLHAGSPAQREHVIRAFRQGLSVTGYMEGQNVLVDYR
jgi:hypothetical protein